MELHGAVNGGPKAREGGDVSKTWTGQNEQELDRGSRKQSRAVARSRTQSRKRQPRTSNTGNDRREQVNQLAWSHFEEKTSRVS